MKNTLHFLKRQHVITGIVFLFTAAVLSSCVKTQNNSQTNQASCVMAVIDLSPDAPALDFYQNSTVLNTNAINYGSGLTYFNSFAGSVAVSFNANGTSTVLASTNLNLLQNHYYTLILANSIAKADFLLLPDTLSVPASSQASIRFVNASATAPAVDVIVKKGSVLMGNIAYKGVTTFVATPAVTNDTLQVVKAGTSTVLATLPGVNFAANGAYTVWLYGVVGATDATKLSVGAMQNAAF
jgi:hypothetical protein